MPSPTDLAEARIEAQSAYRETRGRWERKGLHAIKDEMFWGVLFFGAKSRNPMQHILACLQKCISEVMIETDGGHLALLVAGEAERIAGGFNQLMDDDDILQRLESASIRMNHEEDIAVNSCATMTILDAAAEYDR